LWTGGGKKSDSGTEALVEHEGLVGCNSNPNIPSRKRTNLQRLDEKLRVPGVTNIWTQPIRNRIHMLSTGTRTQVRVKIFGSDLATIEQKVEEIDRVLHQVPVAVTSMQSGSRAYLEIKANMASGARG
jgi:copper/silver efflux system protein